MKKLILITMLAGVFLLSVALVYAGEVDILVRKLEEKGILTKDDAKELLLEIKEEAKLERASEAAKKVSQGVLNPKN